jgi:hypothetical protein
MLGSLRLKDLALSINHVTILVSEDDFPVGSRLMNHDETTSSPCVRLR